MIQVLTLAVLMALPGAAVPATADAPVPAVSSPSCGSTFLASADGIGGTPEVDCTADCGPYANVSCWASGTCTAVDRNCAAGQVGYVECNGVRTYCPACPVYCDDGDIMIQLGSCCSQGGQERERYECQNGIWVLTSTVCGPSINCPWIP